jgi:ATP synthase protein I
MLAGAMSMPPRPSREADAAWSIISTLISGMAVWGFVGWLIDRWTGHSALFLPIGVIVGVAAALYLIIVRIGRS